MRIRLLTYIKRMFQGLKNHAYSKWYSLFLGEVGEKSMINCHCELEGDSLERVFIGKFSVIDSYSTIGCRTSIVLKEQGVIPEIRIGDGCMIGQYNHITAVRRIIIGNNLLTGRFVLITDNSHGGINREELKIHPAKRDLSSKGEVVIGNNVWIGDKVSILPGVHIGDGCIIGSNSVVTHDFPAFSVIAGSPARLIKKGD